MKWEKYNDNILSVLHQIKIITRIQAKLNQHLSIHKQHFSPQNSSIAAYMLLFSVNIQANKISRRTWWKRRGTHIKATWNSASPTGNLSYLSLSLGLSIYLYLFTFLSLSLSLSIPPSLSVSLLPYLSNEEFFLLVKIFSYISYWFATHDNVVCFQFVFFLVS